ncbi:hypothetical protein PDE_06126 [Penicillium oxalicum 114-2]|uniref:Antifungal protein n=1 Tax=Penicillium oxalicum (strain 114-2 / CGMCC 5302) TaxID=933388 RepID=S7ZR83_PENO1|nr:hypothetical protein PDE_06126 [Penicillium oxalicum 114-2]
MKFFYLFAGLLLGVTATSASPAAELNANLLSARDGTYEGECNGTKCKIGVFSNVKCDYGKCTRQSGGGDGKRCHVTDGKAYCPGKK